MANANDTSARSEAFSVRLVISTPAGVVLRVAGEIDLLTADEFERLLYVQFMKHHHVVVDLHDVEYFGARALRVLEEAHTWACRTGTRLHLLAPHDHIVARVVRYARSSLPLLPMTPDEVIDRRAPSDARNAVPDHARPWVGGHGIAPADAEGGQRRETVGVR